MEQNETKKITIRVPRDMHREIKKLCLESEMTMQEFIVHLLTGAVNELDEK